MLLPFPLRAEMYQYLHKSLYENRYRANKYQKHHQMPDDGF